MRGLLTLIVTSVLSVGVLTQKPGEVFHGTWTATGGSVVLRGNWSAQAHPSIANAVHGSWTLNNANFRVVLQGTWLAEKSSEGWRGRWTARTASGRDYSGAWETALPDVRNGTLVDMLQRTVEEQITGSWRYGRLTGNWWLQGLSR
jgi:hypothetical protein